MNTRSVFKKGDIACIKAWFHNEAKMFNNDPKTWAKTQRNYLSQFSSETRNYPEDDFLRALGFLIWTCSLYEEKINRANFWFKCYMKNEIVELPGQRITLGTNLTNLQELWSDARISKVIGPAGSQLIKNAFDLAAPNIKYRHDMVHGHHMGAWMNGSVFRVRGKQFSTDQCYEVTPSPTALRKHGTNMLTATAIISLIDHYFDIAHN